MREHTGYAIPAYAHRAHTYTRTKKPHPSLQSYQIFARSCGNGGMLALYGQDTSCTWMYLDEFALYRRDIWLYLRISRHEIGGRTWRSNLVVVVAVFGILYAGH